MTVKVRPYKRGGWEVDIMLTFPGRPPIRDRRKAPVGSKSAAKRWGEERERQLVAHYTSTDPDDASRPDISKKEVPTLAVFFPRYMEGHCKANRMKPATINQKYASFNAYLLPSFGKKRLDRITAEDIQRFKAGLSRLKNSTLNVQLKHLRAILNVAIEWGVIDKMPTKFKLLKESAPEVKFYDFEEYDRLVLAAEKLEKPNGLLVLLLGGEAGLRRGEISGLRWSDIDFRLDMLTVSRSLWRGQEGSPKGGNARTIPLAERLRAALTEHRRVGEGPVVPTRHGTFPSGSTVDKRLAEVQKAAGFRVRGPHILRHTFCSHLVMIGKPIRAIQELAGHTKITTTERYMHLAPATTRDAIDGLTRPSNWRHVGNAGPGVLKLQ